MSAVCSASYSWSSISVRFWKYASVGNIVARFFSADCELEIKFAWDLLCRQKVDQWNPKEGCAVAGVHAGAELSVRRTIASGLSKAHAVCGRHGRIAGDHQYGVTDLADVLDMHTRHIHGSEFPRCASKDFSTQKVNPMQAGFLLVTKQDTEMCF